MPGRLSTDVGGLRGKVKSYACIETRLSDLAGSEETPTGCIESSVESSEQPEIVGHPQSEFLPERF
jgi:hypothetical protein